MRAKLAEKVSRAQMIPASANRSTRRECWFTTRIPNGRCAATATRTLVIPEPKTSTYGSFVQPLYTPSRHIVLDLGERLAGGLWTLQQDSSLPPELVDRAVFEGKAFLDRYDRPVRSWRGETC